MPGIDKKRVVGKEEDELDELTCGICQDIFIEPVVTQCCRQTYCKSCISEWLTKNNTCPNDRQVLNVNMLGKPPRLVMNLVNKLKIKCENYPFGCKIVLTLEEMKEHSKQCSSCSSCLALKKENQMLKAQLSSMQIEIQSLRANSVSKGRAPSLSEAPILNKEISDSQRILDLVGKWKIVVNQNFLNFFNKLGIESQTENIKQEVFEFSKESRSYSLQIENGSSSAIWPIIWGDFEYLSQSHLTLNLHQNHYSTRIFTYKTFEGNKVNNVYNYNNKCVRTVRELEGGKLTVTSTVDGVQWVRVFKRVI